MIFRTLIITLNLTSNFEMYKVYDKQYILSKWTAFIYSSAFIDLLATKVLYILPHIHPFTH